MKLRPVTIIAILMIFLLVSGYYAFRYFYSPLTRTQRVMTWLRDSEDHADWAIKGNTRCGNAPFLLPTDGHIGYLWGDKFNLGHKHQGIDIFSGSSSGETPVFAIHDGYLTRQPDWKSSLIIRVPEDPLSAGRQIWVYYTHMADENGHSYISSDFPPGTSELYIKSGTLLGYQGNYSGDPSNPTGIHLHLSIVLSDSTGSYKNELNISNTLDPSPYFGLPVNSQDNQGVIPRCNA